MRKVYIAHPLRGVSGRKAEIESNIAKNKEICRAIVEDARYADVVPISPIEAFSFLDPENKEPKYVEKAIGYCLSLLNGCDELWVFGDWTTSEGVMKEITAWLTSRNHFPSPFVRFFEYNNLTSGVKTDGGVWAHHRFLRTDAERDTRRESERVAQICKQMIDPDSGVLTRRPE